MENKDLVPVIQIVNGSIQENLSVIETRVKEIADQYTGLVVTDIKEAKDTVASLRKLSKAINDEKIRAKKVYLAPFEAIEERVKAIGALIAAPVAEIDSQIKTAEQKVKDDRAKLIDDMLGGAARAIGLSERIFSQCSWRIDQRWTNEEYWTAKGNPAGKLTEEIESNAALCRDGINSILATAGEFADQILPIFMESGKLALALSTLEAKKQAKAQAEELRRSRETPVAPKIEPEPAVVVPVEVAAVPAEEATVPVKAAIVPVEEPEEIPAFMREPEPEIVPEPEPESELPAFMRPEPILYTSMRPEQPKPAAPTNGKKTFTLRVTCTDSEFQRVRAAIVLSGITFEVLQ